MSYHPNNHRARVLQRIASTLESKGHADLAEEVRKVAGLINLKVVEVEGSHCLYLWKIRLKCFSDYERAKKWSDFLGKWTGWRLAVALSVLRQVIKYIDKYQQL